MLAREGVMYGAHGGLQTSGLEAGGLDHARSKLLDDRVIVEKGQTSSLEARKEILDLLQAAMGESLTNNSVNAGLDEDHESILAQVAYQGRLMISLIHSMIYLFLLMIPQLSRIYLIKLKLLLIVLMKRAKIWIVLIPTLQLRSIDQSKILTDYCLKYMK